MDTKQQVVTVNKCLRMEPSCYPLWWICFISFCHLSLRVNSFLISCSTAVALCQIKLSKYLNIFIDHYTWLFLAFFILLAFMFHKAHFNCSFLRLDIIFLNLPANVQDFSKQMCIIFILFICYSVNLQYLMLEIDIYYLNLILFMFRYTLINSLYQGIFYI